MEIKYTARAEYSSGHAINGHGCVSFTSEAAATAWAAEHIQSDPGCGVWEAYTADIHRIYNGR